MNKLKMNLEICIKKNSIVQFILGSCTRWANKVNPKYSTHKFVKYWQIF